MKGRCRVRLGPSITHGGTAMHGTFAPARRASDSFRDLLVAALPHLRAYARSLTGNADQADDLVQDTALRLLGAEAQYIRGTNFRAWAVAALRNRFIDIRRRLRFHGGSIENIDPTLFVQQANQEQSVVLNDARRIFAALTPPHREILTLVGINGWSYEQAARALKIPVGTVRSRLVRARLAFRELLEGLPRRRHAWMAYRPHPRRENRN